MKSILQASILMCLFLGSQGERKVSKKSFDELILGRWELTDVTVDGFKRSTGKKVNEYEPGELIVNDSKGRRVFATWKFYEKEQTLIQKVLHNGGLWAKIVHYATTDSISYEYVTINGVRTEKWMKIKEKP